MFSIDKELLQSSFLVERIEQIMQAFYANQKNRQIILQLYLEGKMQWIEEQTALVEGLRMQIYRNMNIGNFRKAAKLLMVLKIVVNRIENSIT